MTHKALLSAAAFVTFSLVSAAALADVPMPECVDNPACQQPEKCSVSPALGSAPAGVSAFVLAAAAALLARRRRAR